jgi:hypothetical protein
MRTPKTLKALVAVGAVVALTSACGGGGSDDSSSSADSSSKSSTTTTSRPAADAATTALAKDATLLATDYPAGWKVQTEAKTREVSEEHCEYTEGGAYASLADGAGQTGPIMQLGEEPAFVSSRAWVFPDEAAATAFVATINSKDWETCQIDALNDFQKKQKTTAKASLVSRESPELGQNHFESFAEIKLADPAKPDETIGNYVVSVFRWGRVVTMTIGEQQYLEPSVQTTFNDQSYEALSKQFARVNAATADATG